MNTVELIVVAVVVVIEVVRLVVDEVSVVDVDVSVELIVVVAVSICAGNAGAVGLAKDGEVTSIAITKTRITPNVMASRHSSVGRLM